MSHLIPYDVSRCGGATESKCDECARKQQAALDDPKKWFPSQRLPAINGGRCQFFIEVKA